MSAAVARERVLAHRVAAQQFDRRVVRAADLAVLDLGVQEAMGHPAALAFAARLPAGADLTPAIGSGTSLALAWTFRGAPFVHRRSDLDLLAAALRPLSEQDARGRLNETGPSVTRAGIAALEQFELSVGALRSAVVRPTAKGAASTAVSKELPDVLLRDCRPCGTKHVSDSAMRAALLSAGLELDPGTSPPVLRRRSKAKRPARPDPAALAELVGRVLTLLGPTTEADVATYLGVRRADLEACWPDDTEVVTVLQRRCHLTAGGTDRLAAAPPADLVRLLGPFDPYLQAADRALLVPDRAVHKILWPVLGRPGAVLVDGEIVGTWRPKAAKDRITLSVETFAPQPRRVWSGIEDEAQGVARARDAAEAVVTRVG